MAIPLGYQQFTAGAVDTSVGLTLPTTGRQMPTYCIITPLTQGIRWRDDGTAPTAAIGYPLAAGYELMYNGDLNAFRMISQIAGAQVNVAYYYG